MQIALAAAGAVRPENRKVAVALKTSLERFLRRMAAPDVRAGLRAMSDHMLRDIGLTRDQIDNALRAEHEAVALRG